jgi:hypothetical protein
LSPGQRGTWTETVLHFFAGKADGANPSGGLAMDKAGNLYGATAAGGNPFDNGTVYQLSRSQGGNWVNTVLHDFPAGPNDGSIPAGTLAIDGRDTLYGGTVLGGTMNSGAIFRLSHGNNREWKETFLYSFFGGNSDGVSPEAGVIMDGSGNLYGTTEEGGGGSQGFGSGIVFKLDRNFRETVLLHFDATSLTTPVAPLLLDAAGNLYGTAAFGGANSNANCQANFEVGCGGVFRLSRGGPK